MEGKHPKVNRLYLYVVLSTNKKYTNPLISLAAPACVYKRKYNVCVKDKLQWLFGKLCLISW